MSPISERIVSVTRSLIHGFVILCLVLLPVPLRAAAEPPGADSPQALVERMTAAAESGDFAEMAACMTPEARAEMAIMMVAMGGMMIAFMEMGSDMAGTMVEGMTEAVTGEEPTAEQKAEIEAGQREAAAEMAAARALYEDILRRHGLEEMLSEEAAGPAPGEDLSNLLEGVDEIALLSDMMALLEDIGEDDAQAESAPFESPGEFGEIEVHGDRATAAAGDDVLEFVLIDGRWYFDPPEMPGSDPDD